MAYYNPASLVCSSLICCLQACARWVVACFFLLVDDLRRRCPRGRLAVADASAVLVHPCCGGGYIGLLQLGV
jgi:hypothetical protein